MSDIIKCRKESPDALGRAIKEQEASMLAGNLLEDHLVTQALREWINTGFESNPDLVVVSGFPRSFEQLDLLKMFDRWLVVYIQAQRKDSNESIRKRLLKANGKKRADDLGGEVVMNKRWNDYLTITKPALLSLEGNLLLLDRKQSLKQRLEMTFIDQSAYSNSPIDRDTCLRALSMLESGTLKDVEQKIAEIET